LSLPQLARQRLAQPRERSTAELESVQQMQAEGWMFLGNAGKGIVILPPLTRDE